MTKLAKKIILFSSVVLIDQLIKYLVVRYFPNIVHFNSNAAFNLKINFLIICLAFFAALGLIFFLKYSLLVIIFAAAGLSNLLDRTFRPGVVDYINLKFWPPFNLADVFILLGAVWIAIEIIQKQNKFSNKK